MKSYDFEVKNFKTIQVWGNCSLQSYIDSTEIVIFTVKLTIFKLSYEINESQIKCLIDLLEMI